MPSSIGRVSNFIPRVFSNSNIPSCPKFIRMILSQTDIKFAFINIEKIDGNI